MSGVDAVRGFGYQHAHAVLTALHVLSDESLSAMRVEGVYDVVDIEVHARDGSVLLAQQVKIRQASDTWGKGALVDVLRRWAALDLADGASFEFVTDGRLGPSGEHLHEALMAAASGDCTSLASLLGEDVASRSCQVLSRASIRQEPTGVEPILQEAQREVRAMLPPSGSPADDEEDARQRVSDLYRLLSVRAGEPAAADRIVTRDEISEVLGGLAYLADSQRWPGTLRESYQVAARATFDPSAVPSRVFPLQPGYGMDRLQEDSSCTLAEALACTHPVILAGPTGSGKSTAARQLRTLAAKDGRSVLVAHAETYIQGRLDALAAAAVSAHLDQDLPMRTGRQALGDPTVTLLIDGVSEVPLPVRQSLQVDVQRYASRAGARIVLVGRDIAALRSALPSSAPVQGYAMVSFERARREEVVRRKLGASEWEAREWVAQADQALGDASGNPMLFTMAIDLMRDGVAFSDRASMYRATVARMAERGGASEIDLTSGALGIVFSQLIDGGRRYANPLEWQRLLAAAVARLKGLGVDLPLVVANEAISRSGVVTPIGYTQTRAPLHDSYADYFAGVAHAQDLVALPEVLAASDEQRVEFCAEAGGVTESLVAKVSRDLPFSLVRIARHEATQLREESPRRLSVLLDELVADESLRVVKLWRESTRIVGFLCGGESESGWIEDSREALLLLESSPAIACREGVGELGLAVRLWRLAMKRHLRHASSVVRARPATLGEACAVLSEQVTQEVDEVNQMVSTLVPPRMQSRLREALGPVGIEAAVFPEREAFGQVMMWPLRYSSALGVRVLSSEDVGPDMLSRYEGSSTVEHVINKSPRQRAVERLISALNLLTGENWLEGI